jgi:hypothetical protein
VRRTLCCALLALVACSPDEGSVPLEVRYVSPTTRGATLTVAWEPVEGTFGDGEGALDPESVTVMASAGLTFAIIDARRDRIETLLAIDASAPLGRADVELVVVEGERVMRFAAHEAFEITEPDGIEVLGEETTLSAPSGAALAWIAPVGGLARVEVSLDGAGELALLDRDGRFPRSLAFHRSSLSAVIDGPRAVAVRAGSGPFTVRTRQLPLRAVEEQAGNTSVEAAAPLGLPGGYVAASTLTGGEARYFSIDLSRGAVGGRLYVETRSDDPATDTRITLIRDDRRSLFGPPSADLGALDTLVSPAIVSPGRYFVRVDGGSRFDPAHGAFSMLVVMR